MIGNLDIHDVDIDSAFVDTIKKVGRVAIDCETTGLDWRRNKLRTVQLFVPESNDCSIVRIRTGAKAPNLVSLLEDAGTEKIFHHALFDLKFLTQIGNFRPYHTSCTKVAAKVIYPNPPMRGHSLQSLLAHSLDIHISKDMQTSDWSVDKLSPRQLEYAIEDVAYLAPLLDSLLAIAKKQQLETVVRDSFAYIGTRLLTDIRDCGDIFSY